ncbi:UDP-glucose:glycoprotein glucosyltransferase [Striga asiatica]|uniref:UDP-glucose:glycoprotein glucosyltransferase n=1 Tax=Striga asiatica TaxID=4170 RepID=A0A5A7QH88_STRAF|nr:UDP-glucose:glycoprotein glucosyltransferase [Striga asiatica]
MVELDPSPMVVVAATYVPLHVVATTSVPTLKMANHLHALALPTRLSITTLGLYGIGKLSESWFTLHNQIFHKHTLPSKPPLPFDRSCATPSARFRFLGAD